VRTAPGLSEVPTLERLESWERQQRIKTSPAVRTESRRAASCCRSRCPPPRPTRPARRSLPFALREPRGMTLAPSRSGGWGGRTARPPGHGRCGASSGERRCTSLVTPQSGSGALRACRASCAGSGGAPQPRRSREREAAGRGPGEAGPSDYRSTGRLTLSLTTPPPMCPRTTAESKHAGQPVPPSTTSIRGLVSLIIERHGCAPQRPAPPASPIAHHRLQPGVRPRPVARALTPSQARRWSRSRKRIPPRRYMTARDRRCRSQ
jgi:hypothetical protein